MSRTLIDVSAPACSGMAHWPGDPDVKISRQLNMARDSAGNSPHQIKLGAGIWMIERLNFAAVDPGRCELICLPPKLLDAEGAPARVKLRTLGR